MVSGEGGVYTSPKMWACCVLFYIFVFKYLNINIKFCFYFVGYRSVELFPSPLGSGFFRFLTQQDFLIEAPHYRISDELDQ